MPKVKPIPSRSLTREERINRHYSPQQVGFIYRFLGENELGAIDRTKEMDERDYLLIALTDWMLGSGRNGLVEKYSHPHYLDPMHQRFSICSWFEFAGEIERQENPGATDLDIVKRFKEGRNAERHAIWYSLRYPDKVELNGRK